MQKPSQGLVICLMEVENLPHGSGKAVSWQWKNCCMEVEPCFMEVEKLSHGSKKDPQMCKIILHGSEKASLGSGKAVWM